MYYKNYCPRCPYRIGNWPCAVCVPDENGIPDEFIDAATYRGIDEHKNKDKDERKE